MQKMQNWSEWLIKYKMQYVLLIIIHSLNTTTHKYLKHFFYISGNNLNQKRIRLNYNNVLKLFYYCTIQTEDTDSIVFYMILSFTSKAE